MGTVKSTIPDQVETVETQTNLGLHVFPSSHKTLPPKKDLRSSECSPYFPSVKQSLLGSDVSYATVSAWQCGQRRKKAAKKDFVTLSTPYNYYFARTIQGNPNFDSGTTIEASLMAAQHGLARESSWTQRTADSIFNKYPPHTAVLDALNFSVTSYKKILPSIQNLKACLVQGLPFMFTFDVTRGVDHWFQSPHVQKRTGYILNAGSIIDTTILYDKTVLAVAYDDSVGLEGAFLVRTSFGSSWGLQGHFWIPYANIMYPEFSKEFFIIDGICDSQGSKRRCVTEPECSQFYSAEHCMTDVF